jgi:hypothetical protein
MNFANGMSNITSQTLSENLGVVYKSTGGGALLDLFATIGGMRNQPINEVIAKWRAAYKENPEYAANLILYTRSIRDGGVGERKIARALYRELAILEPEKVKRNFQTIVDTGRWDDLYSLEGTPCEDTMWEFIKNRLILDVTLMKKNKPISLVSKWLKSINTSSAESRRIAKVFCAKTGLTPKTYRKTLSRLRAYLKVTEVAMSANQWKLINFEAVPSLAMSRYNKAFRKHTPIEFQTYLEGLQKGTVKINAATLNPSDICKKYLNRCLEATDIAQLDSLPNYVSGEHEVLCVADVSGSMSWPNNEPMAASIGLATYFAQKNNGSYHNLYMTFSQDPQFLKIQDNWDIEKCFDYVMNHGVGYNTNADKMMSAIYNLAVQVHDAPRVVIIISDGEFDSFCRDSYLDSLVSKWNKKFINAGLNPVRVISWNVACRHGTVIAPNTDNVSFVSGYGAGPFKNLVELIELNAEEAMIKILTKPEFTWK